jgi:hypothetical protein
MLRAHANDFAKESPTIREPKSPGLFVTATAFISVTSNPAFSIASFTTA